jgi:hypothetical protein
MHKTNTRTLFTATEYLIKFCKIMHMSDKIVVVVVVAARNC